MKSVLCIFAHPDDEIFAGGTLVHLAENGVEVHLLCVTHGENGAPGYPPIANRHNLGRIRTDEMHCAARVIGAKTMEFLDYIDQVGSNNEMIEFTHDPAQFRSEISDHIKRKGADVVITHGSNGEYGHPAHKLVHRSVLATVEAITEFTSPLVYSFQANFEAHADIDNANTSDPAHIIIQTQRYLQSHIMRLFECHHTQSSFWVHLKSEKLGRPATTTEAWHIHAQEGFHRHFPVFQPGQPDDDFMQWFKKYNPPEFDS